MTNDPTMNNGEPGIPPNAVSLYGQNDAMDDFPVLKAFQQYIDAEQAKAQKRMTTLCIFFAIILSIVIGVFVLLLLNVGQRNTALNDQLLQFMMKDRDRQPVVVQNGTPANNDATVKMLTDSLAAMQKQMAEQQTKMLEHQAKMFEQQAKATERAAKSPSRGSAAKSENSPKKAANDEKLKKEMALIAAEKEKLAKEKEALRQQKIELQRRKLYPDYYAKKDAEAAEAAKPAKPAPQPQKPQVKKPEVKKPTKQQTQAEKDKELDDLLDIKPEDTKVDLDVQADGSIRYFSDDENDVKAEPPKKATPPKKVTPPPAPKATPPAQAKKTITQSPSPSTPPSLPESKDISLASGWEIPLE